jgi:tRNA (cytidine56-2'-O)-methyltransferase
VALTARALGAEGIIVSDVQDENIRKSVDKIVKRWGGPFFIEMGTPWKKAVEDWRAQGGLVVHLTVYGRNLTPEVLGEIKARGKPIMVIVGSQKVPVSFFSEKISDFNVAVGNQPHSEISSLAVFLDRYFEGKELEKQFEGGELRIIPQHRGKKIVKIRP